MPVVKKLWSKGAKANATPLQAFSSAEHNTLTINTLQNELQKAAFCRAKCGFLAHERPCIAEPFAAFYHQTGKEPRHTAMQMSLTSLTPLTS